MTYASQQDLIERFGEDEIRQLSDRDRDGTIDAAVVARALADADALIDSYIGKRHKLPLEQTPPQIASIAATIAFFNLFRNDPPEYVEKANEAAQKFLKDVSQGHAVIEFAVTGEEPPRDGQVVLTSGPERVFSRDKLGGF